MLNLRYSFRYDFPTDADANGMALLLYSSNLRKLRNWPCAVSGCRYTGAAVLGPMVDLTIRLNGI